MFGVFQAKSQDDLLDLLEQETQSEETTEYAYATFKATRIINGQSVENTAGGNLNFIIAHRFGKINDGIYELFGLDNATIRLGLEYGITDWLNVGVGRSSFLKTVDAYGKWRLVRQSSGAKNFPFTASLFSNVAMNGMKWPEPDRENYFTSRLSFASQLLIARKFSNAFSFQLTPSYVHRNFVETKEDQNDVFAIGAGGRLKLTNRLSINAEYFYQLPGVNADKFYNSIALGIDIETGGHVFQFHVTNSKGMVEQYFIANTTGDFLNGDIYFGFNINRVFTLKKEK
jgi:hypothetical protein